MQSKRRTIMKESPQAKLLKVICALENIGYDADDLIHMQLKELMKYYEEEVLMKEVVYVTTATANGGTTTKRAA